MTTSCYILNPTDIDGLLHWFRADYGVNDVSGSVTTMFDIIGTAHATENGMHRPQHIPNAINGHPKIRFGYLVPSNDPGDNTDSLDINLGTLNQPFTIMLVWQQYGWQGPGPFIDGSGDTSRCLVLSDDDASFQLRIDYNSTIELRAGSVITGSSINNAYREGKDSFGVTLLRCDTTASSIINNGLLVAQGNIGTGSIDSTLHISGRDVDWRDAAYVDIAEMCVFTGSLQSIDVLGLTEYARQRYALK